jgi:hypothetical protein
LGLNNTSKVMTCLLQSAAVSRSTNHGYSFSMAQMICCCSTGKKIRSTLTACLISSPKGRGGLFSGRPAMQTFGG